MSTNTLTTEKLTREMLSMQATLQTLLMEIRSIAQRLPQGDEEDLILNMTSAATYCGVTRQTIARLVKKEVLHKVTKGARTGILVSELNKVRNLKNQYR